MRKLMTNKRLNIIGIGDTQFTFAVYIANQPDMPEYKSLKQLTALQSGDINVIGQVCGNGWRKVFNVYAKLLYALDKKHYNFARYAPTWQQYRDNYLLQNNSHTALLFTPPKLCSESSNQVIHIICGRTYAKKLINESKLETKLLWLDEEFAVDLKHKVVVCPYFDYRQLSNLKIQRLSMLLSGVKQGIVSDFA